MIDIKEQTFEDAEVLFDRKLLKFIMKKYLATKGMTLEEIAAEYKSPVLSPDGGDSFVAAILDDKAIVQFVNVNGNIEIGAYLVVLKKVGEKNEDAYEGTYYKLPSIEELEAFLMN